MQTSQAELFLHFDKVLNVIEIQTREYFKNLADIDNLSTIKTMKQYIRDYNHICNHIFTEEHEIEFVQFDQQSIMQTATKWATEHINEIESYEVPQYVFRSYPQVDQSKLNQIQLRLSEAKSKLNTLKHIVATTLVANTLMSRRSLKFINMIETAQAMQANTPKSLLKENMYLYDSHFNQKLDSSKLDVMWGYYKD